jgi:hypothetical protein
MRKKGETDQRIPGGIALGKGVRFARQGIHVIAQAAIQALDARGPWLLADRAQRRHNLNRLEMAVGIAVCDGLGQTHGGRNHEARTTTSPRIHGLPVDAHHDRAIAPPAIAVPRQGAPLSAAHRQAHRLCHEGIADAPGGTRHDEARGALDYQTPPPRARVGLLPIFFCTNDQNASISTALRRRSWPNTSVKAAACAAAATSRSFPTCGR